MMDQNEPQHIMREQDRGPSHRRHAHGYANASARRGKSGYTPARGFEIIAIMAEGYSVGEPAAAAMGFHRDKIIEWQKQHPEFASAVKRGQAARLWKLETDLLRARKSSVVRARKFMLEHAYRIEQRDEDVSAPVEDPLRKPLPGR